MTKSGHSGPASTKLTQKNADYLDDASKRRFFSSSLNDA